jgi:tripartite-type tricarboxylate transporter receptor subunit TctC
MIAPFRRLIAAAGIALAGALPALAQDYPVRPVQLLIPYAPGGATDVLARQIAEAMSERLGQRMVPDNKPGAATALAAGLVARAAPNGYTLLFSTGTHAVNAAMGTSLPFDPVNDFEFIGKVGQIGFLVMTGPQVKANTLGELMELARRQALQYGSAGAGSQGHLGTEYLLYKAGAKALHVPYKGETGVLPDLIGGRLDFFICTFTACASQLGAGLKALAVTTPKRSPLAPNVPTMAEAGFPGTEFSTWFFLAAPKGTPAAVVQKLNAALNEVLADEAFRARLVAGQVEPEARTTPAATRSLVQSEITKWRAVKAATGIN